MKVMYKIRTSSDVVKLEGRFSNAVLKEAKRLTAIFDENYNCDSVDGGFVAVIENTEDIEYLKEYYVDCFNDTYEYADLLSDGCSVSILYLVGTEYAINVIMPRALLPSYIVLSNT